MIDKREYYATREWKERRAKCLGNANHQCQILHCENRATIAHHLNYENFGDESPQDLQAVCSSCHDKIHQRDVRQPETSTVWTGIYYTNDAGDRRLMSLYPGFAVDQFAPRKLFSETPEGVVKSYFLNGDFVFQFKEPLDWQTATVRAREITATWEHTNKQ